jgi:hypothetical protein
MSPYIKRILIALVAVLVVVAGVLAYFRFFAAKPAAAPTANTNTPTAGLPQAGSLTPSAPGNGTNTPGALPTFTIPVAPKASAEERLLQTLMVAARDFAEVYGSYSSDGNFANLEALLPQMTDRFRTETENYIEKNRASAKTGKFVGVTVKALGVKPLGEVREDQSVTVTVSIQKTTVGGASPGVSYGTMKMVMMNTGGVWLTDSVVSETQ